MTQLQFSTFDYITIKMQSQPIVPGIADSREEENILIVKRDTLKKSEHLEVYEYQVSGKTPKYIDNIHGVIYKLFSQSEYDFYQFIKSIREYDERSGLKAFLPQYMGIVSETELDGMQNLKKQFNTTEPNFEASERTHRNLWIDHIASRKAGQISKPNYICLKNLTFNYQSPNILDLKLGKKKPKKSNAKFQTSTTNSHGFRINGMVVQLHNGQQFQECFVSKYFGQKITVDEIENYLALFFFDGKKINHKLLASVLTELNVLIASFKKFRGIKFISSSLFISFDASDPSKYCLKLIDFDKYQRDEQIQQDTNILIGLQSIAAYLTNICKGIEQHQQLLVKKELQIFGEDIVIVPQDKMAEYKFKKADEQENCT